MFPMLILNSIMVKSILKIRNKVLVEYTAKTESYMKVNGKIMNKVVSDEKYNSTVDITKATFPKD